MIMRSVVSTDILRVGYESGTLHIQFKNGALYSYHNVPEHLYVNLISASSVGSFFHQHIKGRYGDVKIG